MDGNVETLIACFAEPSFHADSTVLAFPKSITGTRIPESYPEGIRYLKGVSNRGSLFMLCNLLPVLSD